MVEPQPSPPSSSCSTSSDGGVVRSDESSGGYYWVIDLPGGYRAHGYTETRSEAETLIYQYRQAAIRELRRRGPRTVWGAP